MLKRFFSSVMCFLVFAILILPMSTRVMAQANINGQWSTISTTMPINPIHVALLNTGKILVVAGSGNCPPSQKGCPSGPPYSSANGSGALVFDPVSEQVVTQISVSWDMFCNAMVLLQGGRVLIDGGTIRYDPFYGQPLASLFTPASNTFSATNNMAHGRWYPTLVTLGDGRVMTFSGLQENGGTNSSVELYTAGVGWSTPYEAPWTPDLYPRLHLLPNGEVFYSGSQTVSKLFNPATTTWNTNIATTNYSGTRTYGTSVLLPLTPANNYDPQIMIFGGGNPATSTTEIIDLGAASPKWVYGPNMSEARIEMNAVLLPNGKVLALGGSVNDEDTGSLSLNADLFDLSTVNLSIQPPSVGTMSSAGANASERLYHSVALLLPDATVWVAGGNPSRGTYNKAIEIYQPPYLFNSDGSAATRPSITTAPNSVGYGKTFTVQTPNAASISSVVLVRNGTVTHAFGMDQRLVAMSFTNGSGSLSVTSPPNSNIAPPGYYMMFILNSSGVPSEAHMLHVNNPAPTIMNVSPNTGTAAGGTAVTVTGTQFAAGAAVTFGGVPATNVSVVNSTTITATTPAHSSGAVPVGVTVSGETATLTKGYTYTGGSSPISLAQPAAAATPQGSTASVSVAYSLTQIAGDLNVVAVGWNDTTAAVQSVTDSLGNTYTLAAAAIKGTGLTQAIYYAKNIRAGTNTVTVTFTQAAAYPDIRILEYKGLNQTTPLDVTTGASGTSGNNATVSSGSATTLSANELIFGAGMTNGGFSGAGSSFTARVITSDSDIAEDKVVSTTGSYSATATLGSYGSQNWIMQLVTFKQ